jgi:hypothetical protein
MSIPPITFMRGRSSSARCRWYQCIQAVPGFLRNRHFRILRPRRNLTKGDSWNRARDPMGGIGVPIHSDAQPTGARRFQQSLTGGKDCDMINMAEVGISFLPGSFD